MSHLQNSSNRISSEQLALIEARQLGYLVDNLNFDTRVLRSRSRFQRVRDALRFSPKPIVLPPKLNHFIRDKNILGKALSFEDLTSIAFDNHTMADFSIADFNRMIPDFKGDANSLPVFLKRCETFHNTLNDASKAKFLSHLIFKLSGKAFTIFESRKYDDWPTLKKDLSEGIKITKSTSALQSELLTMKQQENQSCKDFADEIKEKLREMHELLINNFQHPEVISSFKSEHEKLAVRTFREGLKPPLKYRIVSCDAKSLDEIIRKALEEEPFVRVQKLSTEISGPSETTSNNFRQAEKTTFFKPQRGRNSQNSFFLNQNSNWSHRPSNFGSNNFRSHLSSNNSFDRNNTKNFSNSNNFESSNRSFHNNGKNKLICLRCGRRGHSVDTCYAKLSPQLANNDSIAE